MFKTSSSSQTQRRRPAVFDANAPQGTLLGFFIDNRAARLTRTELAQGPTNRAALLIRDDAGAQTVENPGGVDPALVEKYSRWTLRGETLLLVQVPLRDMDAAFDILRRAKGGRPVTFVLIPPVVSLHGKDAEKDALDAQSEAVTGRTGLLLPAPLNGERLEDDAEHMAMDLVAVRSGISAEQNERDDAGANGRGSNRQQIAARARASANQTHASLFARLKNSEEAIEDARERLDLATRVNLPTSTAVDWLLDNAFLIREHSEDVERSLTRAFLRELPLVEEGGGPSGLPRAYAVASRLIADTDARLDVDNIARFVQAFQRVTSLEMAELWAMPLLLRLRLMEVLSHISRIADMRQRERELADFWASRMLTAQRRDPKRLGDLVRALGEDAPQPPTRHLIDQLIGHLQDEEAAQSLVRTWAEETLHEPIGESIAQAQSEQAASIVSLSHAIGSLRQLAQINWRDQFEALSLVQGILVSGDPVGVYARMDFTTRDQYRHAVEEIARAAPAAVTETVVADTARDMARLGEDDLRRHIGYYLTDKGRPALEERVGAQPPVMTRFRRFARRRAGWVYSGAVALLTVVVAAIALHGCAASTGVLLTLLLGALALLPASELAVQIANMIVTRSIGPRPLPKMDFVSAGIPDAFRTLCVVPMMLLTPEAIDVEVRRLEIRYLANPNKNLVYGLLADYADAPVEHMPEDAERLDAVARGITNLNERYGSNRFFLFHRERKWSESEDRWIGWERKRGKLEQLNAFLRGEGGAEVDALLRVGDRTSLGAIKFVITLDADTQLPRDTAARLVGTLAHPLNAPRLTLDGRRIERGYTIIQPRVTTSLPSATETRFSRLFTPFAGTDPYTNAISDVYQDLAGEGSYHGKGIYDVHAFHSVLGDRFPEAHLLSHDLIEGNYVHVGLASDIELFDQFPRDYQSFARRNHRWIRGDWQIIDWMANRVPTMSGHPERNPLGALERYKIFDNLRRSLMPVATTLLLLIGWLFSADPARWTWLVAATYLLPLLSSFIAQLFNPAAGDKRSWRAFASAPVRSLVDVILLPHQATLAAHAIGLVLLRRQSRRNLLEWETASESRTRARDRQKLFLWRIALLPASALFYGALLLWANPAGLAAAAPLLLLWATAPLTVSLLSMPAGAKGTPAQRELTGADRMELRALARQTWRYFDDFVGPQSQHLPPDNFQEFEGRGIAPRTSPTNIGLWLLSALAAHDLGYVTLDTVYERTEATIGTLENLEKVEGHLLNWYDTNNGAPLHPRYVSWVDSGNLLASLWTLLQGYDDLLYKPILSAAALRGLADTVGLMQVALQASAASPASLSAAPPSADAVSILLKLCAEPFGGLDDLVLRLRSARQPALDIASGACGDVSTNAACRYWATQLVAQVNAFNGLIDRYLGWVEVLSSAPDQGLVTLGQEAHEWRRQALEAAPSLHALAVGDVGGLAPLLGVQSRADALHLSGAMRDWLNRLHELSEETQWMAGERVADLRRVRDRSEALADGMNLAFLYDANRRAFRIGYNVEDRRGDNSYYDLLASEARLGSFAAVACGAVPVEHWWALGRPFGQAFDQRVLLSWSGTMFEYLMPALLMRSYADSLLQDALETVVHCQIDYAKERGIPWGISEAAYSALDAGHVYQYYAFGVPGVGMKRGLQDGLVVAPYATALALSIAPAAAVENLRRLTALGLRTDRGLYESIDYTRQTAPDGQRGVPVQCYMAHHQGMSLLAIDNVLNDNIMPARFHADGRVRATESLLHERIPFAPPLAEGAERDAPPPLRVAPEEVAPARGLIDRPDTATPRTQLLSNGTYHVMVTNAGGGYSRLRDTEIARWRADTTRDDYGTFVYLRDADRGAVWSATYQPTLAEPDFYSAVFTTEKAEFRRRDQDIETFTEVVVSPEDNAEIRRVTLINKSDRTRHIEMTSYAEVALAPHAADRAAPAFSKLFIQTESLKRGNTPMGEAIALLANRRPRGSNDPQIWAGHTLTIDDEAKFDRAPLQWETNRSAFLGRGRTPQAPAALDGTSLGGSEGAVLDPVFSLRRTVVLEPGARAHVAFVTVAGASRDEVVGLVEKYRDYPANRRAFELAWNRAQLELRHLRLTQDEVQRFQQLAGCVLYPQATLRPAEDRLKRNHKGQSELWKYGISGDLPLVVVTIRDLFDAYAVRETLLAHTYWNLRGLKVDLVILNEEGASYDQPLHNQLARLVQTYAQETGIDQPGGVFLRPARDIAEEDRILLLTVARVVLIAARGSLAQQLSTTVSARDSAPAVRVSPAQALPYADAPDAQPLPPVSLQFANGLGGFSPDENEYVITLDGQTENTPMPWVNVIAGPDFGTIATEAGIGYTWHANSQSNKLTPWSNDPTANPTTDAIYLRDEATGALWTTTPLPIREAGMYRTRHGQGYTVWERICHGIAQELTVFVVPGEHPIQSEEGGSQPPVRLQILKLRNTTDQPRHLTATAYAAWTLGVDREEMQMHVVTEWDPENNCLIATNGYRPDFGGCAAFLASSLPTASYTGDRNGFLGRNGATAAPTALRGKDGQPLSGTVGAGHDPCGALQVAIDLEPGGEMEVVFLLGEANTRESVAPLLAQFRAPDAARAALDSAKGFWRGTLDTIKVETPDEGVDLLLNRWLLYQDLSCRVWGRSAFYQSGGAFGFRDQLQDVMGVLYALPEVARAQIVLSAAHQFVEGDVQHWWHPPGGAGVRTRISDDLLWLPYVTAQYVRVTGDVGILNEQIPFLTGKVLGPDEHESFFQPTVSDEKGSLLEHCRRAIAKGLTKSTLHGLPLIGGGDWNDGLNRVGIEGKGESVWLAWFLVHTLSDWAELLDHKAEIDEAKTARDNAVALAKTIEETAWDGNWYRRGYYDDGTPLGSSTSEEGIIDSLPQSWAVISGAGDPARAATALQSVEDRLVKRDPDAASGMILLFTPAFDKTPHDPGYIKGYVPGVRENGGQYTHGSLWVPLAHARVGDGDRAVDLLKRMSPIEHTRDRAAVERYKVEPYVVVADVYALQGQVGRGGWTWYTGSAGWMYRVWLEEVLGFTLRDGNKLTLSPVIPHDWPGFTLTYRHKTATYKITVENPNHVSRGVKLVKVDGKAVKSGEVALTDDGAAHEVAVRMG